MRVIQLEVDRTILYIKKKGNVEVIAVVSRIRQLVF